MTIRIKPPTETEITRQCLEVLNAQGWCVWRQNSGGVKATYKGKDRFFRFHSMPGCSDILGLTDEGKFIAIEVKRPGGKPTLMQQTFIDLVADKGGIALVVTSAVDLLDQLAKLGYSL